MRLRAREVERPMTYLISPLYVCRRMTPRSDIVKHIPVKVVKIVTDIRKRNGIPARPCLILWQVDHTGSERLARQYMIVSTPKYGGP
jgi:hypothetical protein